MSTLEQNEANVKQDEDMKMNTECRACLQRFEDGSGVVNLFEAWTPAWDGKNGTIADDLHRLSNVQVSDSDEHSKVICRTCHQKLLDACTFVSLVQRNDQILKQRYARPQMQLDVSSETIWPKPIQVDKNINNSVIGNVADIEIKQEVLSEDEYADNANGTGLDGDNVDPILDLIKIEPEELLDTKPHLTSDQKVNQNETVHDAIRKDQDILSDSSTDTSNTDTNYTLSSCHTDTDESYEESSENLDTCPLDDEVIKSSEFHSHNNDKNTEVIPMFAEPSNSDSCHRYISNSPVNFLEVTLSPTPLVNETVEKKNIKELNTTDIFKVLQPNEHSISENVEENPTQQHISKNIIRTKDFCIYCKCVVLNFARHLYRHHLYEPEVKVIMSKPKRSIEKQRLLNNLRKRGNFIQNLKDVIKPMRRRKFTDYLPCTNCLGFYSRKNLWRHAKICIGKEKKTHARKVQSDAQNFLIRDFKGDKCLLETVFPRMRPDKISLVAKSDKLICYYASQYIKIHKGKKVINVISLKMRALAKLLQTIKLKNPHIKDLFDVLRSKNYNIIVEAAKVIGKYDIEKDRYDSPNLLLNISNTLKDCCAITMKSVITKQGPYCPNNAGEIESDLKNLILLLGTNWRNDILSQAVKSRNEKRNNKITVASFAYDLKTCKDYFKQEAEEAAVSIKSGFHSVHTYIKLLEIIYCKVLLMNIRRPAELQKIKIHDYLDDVEINSPKYEEFVKILNASEHTLREKFKVVVSGKFVLFNHEVQNDITLLLSVREHYVCESNSFLFGTPEHETILCGYNVIKKHVHLSNVKNPNAIFSTKMRTAALRLISSMSKNDLQQLSPPVGHIIDDVYEIAKILKVLLHLENRHQCNEKTNSVPSGFQQIFNEKMLMAGPSGHQQPKSLCLISEITERKKRCLVPWTEEQKSIVITFFEDHIRNKKPPKKHECEKLKQKHPELLKNKDWLKIKVFIQNVYSKRFVNLPYLK